jgi:hypothetical protein
MNRNDSHRSEVGVHPLDELLRWLPEVDFAVLGHRFASHGRDYIVLIEDCLSLDKGQHEITFTHCVSVNYETRVRDDVWPKSWSDEFTDYSKWISASEPDGYIWGTNWSLAHPGIKAARDSPNAAEWSRRLGKQMFEITLETDLFFLRLIFHSIRTHKISELTETVSQVINPLKRKR